MRKTSKQTIGHAQTDVEINRAGLVVTARPAHYDRPDVSVDMQKARNLQRIAEGAAALSSTFNKLNQIRQKKEDERNTELGRKAALTDGADTLEGYDTFLKGQTEAYGRGYMSQKGLMAANQRVIEDQNFIRDHGHEFQTGEQLKKYLESRYKSDLQGNNNEDYIANYLAGANRNEPALVESWSKDSYLQYQNEVSATATENLRSTLSTLPSDATTQDYHTAMRTAYDAMEAMGGTRGNANKLVVETVGQMAVDQGKPELLDVFDIPSQSVEDPSKRIPGLANSTTFGPKIADWKSAAERARDSGTTKKNQRAIYDGYQSADTLVKQGRINEARGVVENLLDTGNITGSAANTKVNQLEKDYEEMVYAHKQMVAYQGRGPMPIGTTMDERRKAGEANYVDRMAPAVQSGDVQKIMAAKREVMLDDSYNGIINPHDRNNMKLKQPDASQNPAEWNESHNTFSDWKEENPRLLYSEIGATAWNRHALYDAFIDMGQNPATARANTQRYDSPETDKRKSEILSGDKKYALRESIEKAFGGTLKSDALIYDAMDTAATFYAITGDMEVAAKLSVDAYHASHKKVDLPGDVFGQEEHWVDTRGINYGKGYEEAEAAFNKDQELRDSLGITDPDVVIFWDSNPFDKDGTMVAVRSDTMAPVMSNGSILKVNPLTAIQEHSEETIKSNMLTTEEMKAQWQSNRKQSIPHGRGSRRKH